MRKQVMVRWRAYHSKVDADKYADYIRIHTPDLESKVVKNESELLPWAVEVYAPMTEV